MRVCVRVDDFGLRPHTGETDCGLALARKFHKAMRGTPYLAGIIPARLDDAGRTWLISKPSGMTVAMHGIAHEKVSPQAESEFAFRARRECSSMVRLGKTLLGVPTRYFIAPFNHYGDHLHGVLAENGIDAHWVGPTSERFPRPMQQTSGYSLIFAWKPLYGCLLWPSGSPNAALCESLPALMGLEGKAVLTLHSTWEAARGERFEGIEWLVERYRDSVMSPEEFLK
jgi:hypothetical protein